MGADVNAFNRRTNWGVLHWLSVNGDSEWVEAVTEAGGYPFIPDFNGMYPIDLASISNNQKLIRVLIRETLKYLQNFGLDRNSVNTDLCNQNTFTRRLETWENLSNNNDANAVSLKINFLFNPVLHTKLLYYAVKFKLSPKVISRILQFSAALPNGPVLEAMCNTPLHIACQNNSKETLAILLKHLAESLEENNSLYNVFKSKVKAISPHFKPNWKRLLKLKKYAGIRKNYKKFK